MIDVLSAASDDECQAPLLLRWMREESSVKGFFDSNADLDGMVNAIYPRGKGYGAGSWGKRPRFPRQYWPSGRQCLRYCASVCEYFKSRNEPFSLVNLASIYGSLTPRFNITTG